MLQKFTFLQRLKCCFVVCSANPRPVCLCFVPVLAIGSKSFESNVSYADNTGKEEGLLSELRSLLLNCKMPLRGCLPEGVLLQKWEIEWKSHCSSVLHLNTARNVSDPSGCCVTRGNVCYLLAQNAILWFVSVGSFWQNTWCCLFGV